MTNYCSGCGLAIPKPQHICSFCYGDPYYGSDGYLMDFLLSTQREEYEREEIDDEFVNE